MMRVFLVHPAPNAVPMLSPLACRIGVESDELLDRDDILDLELPRANF